MVRRLKERATPIGGAISIIIPFEYLSWIIPLLVTVYLLGLVGWEPIETHLPIFKYRGLLKLI